jgi:hypothetical protein
VITCRVKRTHDGGIALVDNSELTFSSEFEKLENNPRQSGIRDLGIINQLLWGAGDAFHRLGRLAVDSWRRAGRGGQRLPIHPAPYRRGIRDAQLPQPHSFTALDLSYLSYPHYAGNAASSYCTSPFAPRSEDAHAVCWDGTMFPFLYHDRPESAGQVRHLWGKDDIQAPAVSVGMPALRDDVKGENCAGRSVPYIWLSQLPRCLIPLRRTRFCRSNIRVRSRVAGSRTSRAPCGRICLTADRFPSRGTAITFIVASMRGPKRRSAAVQYACELRLPSEQ